MLEPRTPRLRITIFAICALAAQIPTALHAQPPRKIHVRVDSVLAANTGKGMDAQLASSVIGDRLKALFEYSTYQLVQHQEQDTRCGRMVAFEMPGGRILHIVPRSVLDNMISMELVLFEGTRPLMTTDLKLMNHAVLVVGGPRYHQGMLITMISTDAPDLHGAHGDPRATIPLPPAAAPPDTATIPTDAQPQP
jgi:hypothetical protein